MKKQMGLVERITDFFSTITFYLAEWLRWSG